MARMTTEEGLDKLAALLERDIPLHVCTHRMGMGKGRVYRLFGIMRERLGPQAF